MKPVIILIVVLLFAGCGTARRGEPFTDLQLGSAEARRGEVAFMRHCHACHPGGEAGLGPALNNKPLLGFLIRFQVRRGLGAMPAFPPEELADAELAAVVAYLRELRRQGAPR